MKERPILLGGEWVRAILDGRKTQTRRPIDVSRVKHRADWIGWTTGGDTGITGWHVQEVWPATFADPAELWNETQIKCWFGVPGDRLWVREKFRAEGEDDICVEGVAVATGGPCKIFYAADGGYGPWRPSIHMPRWASRIELEIVDVRADRVRSITDDDAIAEGCVGTPPGFFMGIDQPGESPSEVYRRAWQSIYLPFGYPWETAWCWAITWKVLEIKTLAEATIWGATT